MSDDATIDVSDMLTVHAAIRIEFEALPNLVAAVPDGDAERARVVAEHFALLSTLLNAHHHGEDALLWPVLRERAPEAAALVDRMTEQHATLDRLYAQAQPAVERWTGSADADSAAAFATAVADLSAGIHDHLAQEETEVLPLAARTMTDAEWFAIGEHSRGEIAAADPQLLFLALGTVLAHAEPEAGAAIVADMPPPAQEAWVAVGEPSYRAYRDRLDGA